MHSPADPRVRTGRIDLNYRAVLFKVFLDTIPHYFYYGAWPHDQAIEIARSSVLNVNSANGVLEVLRKSAPGPATTDEVPGAKAPLAPSKPETETPNPVSADRWQNPLDESGIEAAELVSRLGLDMDLEIGRASCRERVSRLV